MRIEQLTAFEKVVQHSSFTKAANELYTTQPSVSKMIDALEDELGHQLLRRTSRGIELTAYGKRVYGDVKTILRMVASWQSPEILDNTTQEVHVQSTTTMCNFLSADFLHCLREKHPNISLLLHESRQNDIIRQMEEPGIHIALLPIRKENQADTRRIIEQIQKNGWDYETVIEDPKCIYLGAEHPLAHRDKVFASDLGSLPLGTYSNTNDGNWLLYSQYFNGDTSYRSHSKDLIFQYVAQGKCAAIFPRFTSQYEYFVTRKAVVPIDVADLDLGYASFLLVSYAGKSLLEAEQTVVACLRKYFKNQGCQ